MTRDAKHEARKPPTLRFKTGSDAFDLRKKLGLNQSEFWGPLGVTQSGGSRYESGRHLPTPVKLLLNLAYGTDTQALGLLAWLRGD